ncbi:DNA cytosine methyltransferase [Desulforhopalus vacuolatus]|uniref:DNA cytosine methyltransferase n=1 Tax=Desulforhopalus vacuolatus TaxID=40414 RepID=UPI001963A9A7|nr:DNA cytosine methyltransferase [Desulforhopalus vacuolatus]MBM9520700.1 DNA cytosine methyltransferase [Desulforhopalus vacuolatus]
MAGLSSGIAAITTCKQLWLKSARYHKDGAGIFIAQPGDRPRRLTVKEAMQLQGYDPRRYVFPVSRPQACRQIGNSVVIPAVAPCARALIRFLREKGSL